MKDGNDKKSQEDNHLRATELTDEDLFNYVELWDNSAVFIFSLFNDPFKDVAPEQLTLCTAGSVEPAQAGVEVWTIMQPFIELPRCKCIAIITGRGGNAQWCQELFSILICCDLMLKWKQHQIVSDR